MNHSVLVPIRRERVNAAKRLLGLSDYDVGPLVGMKPHSFRVVKNRGMFSNRRLPALAEALHVSVEWLIGESDDPRGTVTRCNACAHCRKYNDALEERYICAKHHIYKVNPEADGCTWAERRTK